MKGIETMSEKEAIKLANRLRVDMRCIWYDIKEDAPKSAEIEAGTPQSAYYDLWDCIRKASFKIYLKMNNEDLKEYPHLNKSLKKLVSEVLNPYNEETEEEYYLQFEDDRDLCLKIGDSLVKNLTYLNIKSSKEDIIYFQNGIIQIPKDDNFLRIRRIDETLAGEEMTYSFLEYFEMANYFDSWKIVSDYFEFVELGKGDPYLLGELCIATNYECNLLYKERPLYIEAGFFRSDEIIKMYEALNLIYYELYYLTKVMGLSILKQEEASIFYHFID